MCTCLWISDLDLSHRYCCLKKNLRRPCAQHSTFVLQQQPCSGVKAEPIFEYSSEFVSCNRPCLFTSWTLFLEIEVQRWMLQIKTRTMLNVSPVKITTKMFNISRLMSELRGTMRLRYNKGGHREYRKWQLYEKWISGTLNCSGWRHKTAVVCICRHI